MADQRSFRDIDEIIVVRTAEVSIEEAPPQDPFQDPPSEDPFQDPFPFPPPPPNAAANASPPGSGSRPNKNKNKNKNRNRKLRRRQGIEPIAEDFFDGPAINTTVTGTVETFAGPSRGTCTTTISAGPQNMTPDIIAARAAMERERLSRMEHQLLHDVQHYLRALNGSSEVSAEATTDTEEIELQDMVASSPGTQATVAGGSNLAEVDVAYYNPDGTLTEEYRRELEGKYLMAIEDEERERLARGE